MIEHVVGNGLELNPMPVRVPEPKLCRCKRVLSPEDLVQLPSDQVQIVWMNELQPDLAEQEPGFVPQYP